jgi:hypothetical protein
MRMNNPTIDKALSVLGHAEFFEPVRNLLHGGTLPTHFAALVDKGRCGWRVTVFVST